MNLDLSAIRKFMNREESGAAYVYEKTNRLVKSICFDVLHQDQDAEDAMLDTYAAVLSSGTSFSSDKVFLSYLCVSAKNTSLNLLKARKNIDSIEEDEVGEADIPLESGILGKVQSLLSPEDYELVTLHLCNDLGFGAIALIQGGTASSCRGRYFRAMKKLKGNIAKEDYR